MAISAVTRRRLEIQGFTGLDDACLTEAAPWLRFTPAVCAVLMGIGTGLASAPLLFALVPIALLGAVFPVHPFDIAYNYGLRRLTRTRPLPPNGVPRRFACGMAAVWLAGTASAFLGGADVAGYVLGGVLTSVAVLVSTTHFCIPSMVYRLLFRQPVPAAA